MKYEKWKIGEPKQQDVDLLRSAGYPYLLSTVLASRGVTTPEQAAVFLDRLFFAGGAVLRHKPAAGIAVCRRAGAIGAFDDLNKYFTIAQMPVVSSQYWNMVFGATPEDIRRDAEGLQTMRTLARNMAWLLKCIRAGREQNILPPEPEKLVRTNFIR